MQPTGQLDGCSLGTVLFVISLDPQGTGPSASLCQDLLPGSAYKCWHSSAWPMPCRSAASRAALAPHYEVLLHRHFCWEAESLLWTHCRSLLLQIKSRLPVSFRSRQVRVVQAQFVAEAEQQLLGAAISQWHRAAEGALASSALEVKVGERRLLHTVDRWARLLLHGSLDNRRWQNRPGETNRSAQG